MTIKTEKPLDYTGQVWRGIDDKFPKKIHNATTTSDGLMSAEDKAKLDSIDVKGQTQIYDVVTWESNGLMLGTDKKKLDGIEENANNYVHPNSPELRHVTDEQISYWNSKATTGIVSHTVNGLMTAEDKKKLDLIDETVCNITYEKVTQTQDGLMSKEDKIKIDNIDKVATQSANGLMSKEDKIKIDTIDAPVTYTTNGLMTSDDKIKLDLLDRVATPDNDGLMSKQDKIILDSMGKPASQYGDGLMTYEDKTKLDSIEENANYYVHPNNEGMRHVTDAEKSYWNSKADKNIVTNAENGLMSYIDKIKLDSISEGASTYVHPNDENTRHVTDAQIKKWSSIATITTDGLMSKEDKQLLIKLTENPNSGDGNNSNYDSTIEEILIRLEAIEQKMKTAVYIDK